MVQELVEKTMRKALINFATKEGKSANDISFFIHTKPTDELPSLLPKYFYAVDGVPVQEQNGSVKELDFTKDILGVKIDMLGRGYLTSQFLEKYFDRTSKKHNTSPSQLYVMITSLDENANDLAIALYKESEVIKKITLEEIFMDQI